MNPQRKAKMQVAIVALLKLPDEPNEDDVALALVNVLEPMIDELVEAIDPNKRALAGLRGGA